MQEAFLPSIIFINIRAADEGERERVGVGVGGGRQIEILQCCSQDQA